MTWFMQRSLTLGLVLLLAVMLAPGSGLAAPRSAPDPVFGVGNASAEEEGDMVPTGNGRFTIDDRVYVGKTLGRSVGGVSAACFTGDLQSVEEWSLEAPRMVGTHDSMVTIRSEQGALTLWLRGRMEQFTASGTWQIVSAYGGCDDLAGDGTYTATYSTERSGSEMRLTFDGETQP